MTQAVKLPRRKAKVRPLFDGPEWTFDLIRKVDETMAEIAVGELGLDVYPNQIEVITAAAAIMVVVFGSFILESDRALKLMGVGLATAIFLDATIVRMLLVPSTMELLGDKNWWLPRWLGRILPEVNVEGPAEEIDEPVEREPAGVT